MPTQTQPSRKRNGFLHVLLYSVLKRSSLATFMYGVTSTSDRSSGQTESLTNRRNNRRSLIRVSLSMAKTCNCPAKIQMYYI